MITYNLQFVDMPRLIVHLDAMINWSTGADYLPGDILGHTPEKTELVCSFLELGGELDGDITIGAHLCRFVGLT